MSEAEEKSGPVYGGNRERPTRANPRHDPIDVAAAQAVTLGESKLVDLKSIVPNPWNYNTQPEETFTKLAESLRRYGFVQPIIVRHKGGKLEIINGEHRWRAAQMLSMKQVPVIDLGELDDGKAKQLSIILNELGGSPDQVRLADLLRDINAEVPFEDLSTVMPFTGNELRMYLDSVDFSFDNLSSEDVRPPKKKEEDAAADEDAGLADAELDGESEDEVAGPELKKFTFKVSPEDAKVIRKVLRKLDRNPAVALVALARNWLDAEEPAGEEEPS